MKTITRIIIVLLVIVGFLGMVKSLQAADVNSFEECVGAGYSVAESSPRQCVTPDGRSFVETAPPDSRVPEKQPGDTGVVCTMDAKQCPDGSSVSRVPPGCEFAPCPEEKAQ